MRTAGVIGWPIAHSKSPVIHRFWLRELGIDGDYSRADLSADIGFVAPLIIALRSWGVSCGGDIKNLLIIRRRIVG